MIAYVLAKEHQTIRFSAYWHCTTNKHELSALVNLKKINCTLSLHILLKLIYTLIIV